MSRRRERGTRETTSDRQWTNVRNQVATARVSIGDQVAWDNDVVLKPGVVEAFTDHPAVVVVRLRNGATEHWTTAHPRFRRLATSTYPSETSIAERLGILAPDEGVRTPTEDRPIAPIGEPLGTSSGYYETLGMHGAEDEDDLEEDDQDDEELDGTDSDTQEVERTRLTVPDLPGTEPTLPDSDGRGERWKK